MPLRDLKVNPLRRNRVEPRAVKRRPKSYPYLTEPRQVLQRRLLGETKVGES